jgi:hypothetical protein
MPKALANFSPGLERSDNPGIGIVKYSSTLKGFANCLTLSKGSVTITFSPRVVAALQPWARISERLWR